MSIHSTRRFIHALAMGVAIFFGSADAHRLMAQAPVADSTLMYKWELFQVDKVYEVVGKLHLMADHLMEAQFPGDQRLRTGRWALAGDSLMLEFELLDQDVAVDSAAYVVKQGNPAIVLFSDGKEIARQNNTGFESARTQTVFALSKDPQGTGWILKGKDHSWMIAGQGELIPDSFSWVNILRGVLGMLAMVAILFLFSSNRRKISWRLVGIGISLQLVFAVLVLKVPFVRGGFTMVSRGFVNLLHFAEAGASFVFSGLVTDIDSFGYIFAFQVLPTIVFFSAFTSLLYYLGILQKIVFVFAWVMTRTMKLSGAESLSAAGNIFLGQTESPLLIRPYLDGMNRSEILTVMVGGMATIAGGVFAAYVGYLGGTDPAQRELFATHLLIASIMSAPAAIVAAKILIPATEEVNEEISIPKDKLGANLLEAISNGTTDGLKLAVNVGVMLLVFIAMIAMVNYLFSDVLGELTGLNGWVNNFTEGRYQQFNLQFIFGLLFSPIAYAIGVPASDMMLVGQLLGEKTILNEFVAYTSLSGLKNAGMFQHERSVIIATYALCGFSNFASIGIQIGGIGALAPSKRSTLAQLGIKALIGGTIACFMTAAIAGMLSGI